jgi:branched-chain amino acid transport system substrate-binding protein
MGCSVCGTLDNPANKKFVDEYKAKLGTYPGAYQYMAYISAKIVIDAIKKVGGKVEDRESFTRAIATARLEGPSGLVSFDENNGIITDMFVMKVRGPEGKRENECIDRIPQVSDDYSFK